MSPVMWGETSQRRVGAALRRSVAASLATLLSLTLWVAAPADAAETVEESWLVAAFVAELNIERAARDLPPLLYSGAMSVAADDWAETMDARNDLRHSNGTIEIIGYGPNTGSITNAWMRSPSHRHLITDPNLTIAGIGVSCESSTRMWVAVQFARADVTLGTQQSSSATPRIIGSGSGLSCGGSVPDSLPPAPDIDPVRRLYLAYFEREPDLTGLQYWAGEVASGTRLEIVSDVFADSAEFRSRYGQLNNADFVDLVYENVLGRLPDRAGNGYWVDQLRRGLTRGDLMVGFSESAEFRQSTN